MLLRYKWLSVVMILLTSPCLHAEEMNDKRLTGPGLQEHKEIKKPTISRQQALVIAEQLEVVRSLYELREGMLSNCIEKEVVKPCESGWVTCIEDAWVVKFIVGKTCSIEHDGRLNVTILIDGHKGEVISQYPEVDYFKDKYFCRDQVDCIRTDRKDKNNQVMGQPCYNFIYAQSQSSMIQENDVSKVDISSEAITAQLKERSKHCVCQKQLCENVSFSKN